MLKLEGASKSAYPRQAYTDTHTLRSIGGDKN